MSIKDIQITDEKSSFLGYFFSVWIYLVYNDQKWLILSQPYTLESIIIIT